MKLTAGCLTIALVCSACQKGTSDLKNPDGAQKRRAEIGQIIKDHYESKYGFEVRGPLTVAELEKESSESYKAVAEIKRKVYGKVEEFDGSEMGRACAELKTVFKDGDELYFFTSEMQAWGELVGTEGYVLIRKNKIAHMIVTAVN
jgi:hypothetical protein